MGDMELKHEAHSSDDGVWISVPPPNITSTENYIPDVKTEADDSRSGPSGGPAAPDYAVDVWVPDIKEECAGRPRAASGDGSLLACDNPTRPSCRDTLKMSDHARSSIARAQLPASLDNGKLTYHHEEILSDKHSTKSSSLQHNVLTPLRHDSSNKSFSCEECNKAFSRKSYLMQHVRTHTGEKPFACVVCKKVFSQKSNLLRHLRTHTGERRYACEKCKALFGRKSHLMNHLRTHTGEKPFTCEECKKVFSFNTTLLRHLRIHTGDKRFACDECKKVFIQKSSLLGHLRTHRRKTLCM